MSLFGKLFGRKASENVANSKNIEGYSTETTEAIRKWLDRFFKDRDAQTEFWEKVGVYKNENGHEPKVNDIIWGMLNDRRSKYFEQGNLGLYRNDTMAMCELLQIEGRFNDQFRLAVHLTVLDGCGASNVGWNSPEGVFREDEAIIASVCAPMLCSGAEGMGLSFDELKVKFLEVAQEFQDSFGKRKPMTPVDNIWLQVEGSLTEILAAPNRGKRKASKPPVLNSDRIE
jgi:hypothetical protein